MKLIEIKNTGKKFSDLKIDLNQVHINCSNNKLTSLEGAPQHVGGYFDCSRNKLTSLEGAPQHVGGSFACLHNKLTSLEGAPQHVSEGFYCDNNKLTSLEGAPQHVGGDFYCSNNKLTSLEGAPQHVGVMFYCSNNNLTSLEGAPKRVDRSFNCSDNNLTSLENIHLQIKHIGGILGFSKNPIKSNVLGVLLIGCDPRSFQPVPGGKAPLSISLDNEQVEGILDKYLEKINKGELTPKEAVLQCQNELIDANLDEYAEL